MVTTLEKTITIHSSPAASAIQSVKLSAKEAVSTVLIAHASTGVAQHSHVSGHSKTVDFTVVGHGDLTFDTGITTDHGITLITGGVVFVTAFDYEQALPEKSKWTMTGTHYPYASAA
jgi:hypothetical protein